MLMKRPRHRVFDYPPRFYKPEEDEKERKKDDWDCPANENSEQEKEIL